MKSSSSIAPLGTRTNGTAWRRELKVGDLIDVCDVQGSWILATIVSIKTGQKKEDDWKELHVGYRVYSESGSKMDSAGKHFEGWSDAFDEDVPAFSLRVQK